MKPKRIIGELRSIPENVEETRTVEFVISTERKDRHKSVLNVDGWDLSTYKNNPIVGYQHDVYGDNWFAKPDPDSIIGTSKVYTEDKKLIGAVTFEPADINPLAEKIFRKVLFGSLRTASVGFLPVEKGRYVKEEDTYYYGKRELLEWSIVNIPSNADAVRRSLDDTIEIPEDEIEDTQPVGVPDDVKMRMEIDLTNLNIK